MPLPKNLWKHIIRLSLAACVLYGCFVTLPKFCYRQTGHFWFQTILSDRSFDERWHVPYPSQNELHKINTCLSQPYHFLGGGMQSIVFRSEDKTTVIKFFKHRKSILKKGRFRPHTPFLDCIFASYHIANQQLEDETGTFYIHLNRTTSLHPSLTLIDKIGVAHTIDLDQTEFILQRRAHLICPQLTQWMESGQIDQAKTGLTTLITAFISIYTKGFKSTDYAFRRNVGFINGRGALIDAGSLVPAPSMKNPKIGRQEFLAKGLHLDNWLKRHYPVLHTHYRSTINEEFRGSNDSL